MARWSRFVILAGLLASGQAMGQEVLRESVGERATELAKMELKPFDSSSWSLLEDWTNGSALDGSATDGKVVLIATLASWNPAATRVISSLQALKEKYGDQGLIVVGVHHAQGWDAAPEMMSKRKADFLLAHDTAGKFREAIKADQDPDFYLIDRAGQMRYADIRTESVEIAVKQLIAEDAASAGSVAARMAAEAQQREADASRPRTIQDKIDMRSLPEVPFVAPPAEAYQHAPWPEAKKDDSGRNDQNNGPLARPVPGAGWIGSAEAPKTAGRAVVYYAWRLDDTRSSNVVRDMDQLQRRLGRDVVVVGVLTGVRGDDNGRSNDNVDPADLIRRTERMRRTLGLDHPMLLDIGGQFFNSNNSGGSNEGYPAVVVSSDNMERWSGVVSDPGFRAALDRVINADPGVRARRAAEETFLRARGG